MRKLLTNTLFFLVVGYFLQPNFYVSSIWTALIASIVLGVVNVFIKPFVSFFSFPITLLTFGLFTFVINGLMLKLVDAIIGPGFEIHGFGTAMLIAFLMTLLNLFLGDRDDKRERTERH